MGSRERTLPSSPSCYPSAFLLLAPAFFSSSFSPSLLPPFSPSLLFNQSPKEPWGPNPLQTARLGPMVLAGVGRDKWKAIGMVDPKVGDLMFLLRPLSKPNWMLLGSLMSVFEMKILPLCSRPCMPKAAESSSPSLAALSPQFFLHQRMTNFKTLSRVLTLKKKKKEFLLSLNSKWADPMASPTGCFPR